MTQTRTEQVQTILDKIKLSDHSVKWTKDEFFLILGFYIGLDLPKNERIEIGEAFERGLFLAGGDNYLWGTEQKD